MSLVAHHSMSFMAALVSQLLEYPVVGCLLVVL